MNDKEALYNLLKETFILLDDGDRRLFNQYNLSPPRFYVLHHVYEEPGISSSDLSQKLLCDKSNVTRIVKGLESIGYLEKQPHESDGRAHRIYLTGAGESLYNEVNTAHKVYNSSRLDCLNNSGNENLMQNLTTLNQALQTSLTQFE